MRKLITLKFKIPELRQLLIDTYPANIIEGNYWGDPFWGIDLRTNKGLNWLGILLMEERLSIVGTDPIFVY